MACSIFLIGVDFFLSTTKNHYGKWEGMQISPHMVACTCIQFPYVNFLTAASLKRDAFRNKVIGFWRRSSDALCSWVLRPAVPHAIFLHSILQSAIHYWRVGELQPPNGRNMCRCYKANGIFGRFCNFPTLRLLCLAFLRVVSQSHMLIVPHRFFFHR